MLIMSTGALTTIIYDRRNSTVETTMYLNFCHLTVPEEVFFLARSFFGKVVATYLRKCGMYFLCRGAARLKSFCRRDETISVLFYFYYHTIALVLITLATPVFSKRVTFLASYRCFTRI